MGHRIERSNGQKRVVRQGVLLTGEKEAWAFPSVPSRDFLVAFRPELKTTGFPGMETVK